MQAMRFTLFFSLSYSAHALRVVLPHVEHQGPSNRTTFSTNLMNASTTQARTPSIVIFITTSGSKPHMDLLSSCWPRLMKNRLPTLSRADVILHSNGNQTETELRQVMKDWPNQVVRVAIAENIGKQEGAIASMTQAVENDYFKDYEWVIRINPDVIIMKETNLLSRMGTGYAGVFALCCCREVTDGHGIDQIHVRSTHKGQEYGMALHTDFYAARTHFLIKEQWAKSTTWRKEPDYPYHSFQAEHFAATIGFRNILEQQLDSWIISKGTGPCQVRSEDMIHNHKHHVETCQAFADGSTSKALAKIKYRSSEPEIIFLKEAI